MRARTRRTLGLMATPADPKFKMMSYALKVQGLIFMSIFFVGYFVKWGMAWHDAGVPLTLDIKYHPVRPAVLQLAAAQPAGGLRRKVGAESPCVTFRVPLADAFVACACRSTGT